MQVELNFYDYAPCPHCGKPVKGMQLGHVYSWGNVWHKFLREIEYTEPYQNKNKLSVCEAKSLMKFVKKYNIYDWEGIRYYVDDALKHHEYIEINADW